MGARHRAGGSTGRTWVSLLATGTLLIGVVENLAGGYLGSAFKTATAFVMIVALLAVRPQGLLGIQKRREV